MGLAMSELLQTAAVVVVTFLILTLLSLFLKAESATWKKLDEEATP